MKIRKTSVSIRHCSLSELARTCPNLLDVTRCCPSFAARLLVTLSVQPTAEQHCSAQKIKKCITCSGGWKQQSLNFFQGHRLSVMISVRTMRSIFHTSSRTPKWRSSLPVSASRNNDNVG